MQYAFSHWFRAALVGAPLVMLAAAPNAFAQTGDFGTPPGVGRSATTTTTEDSAPAKKKTVKKKAAASSEDDNAPTDLHNMHHAGMWMFEYRFMRMVQDGVLMGMQQVDPASLLNNPNYVNADGEMAMSIGTDMTMDMHMFMGMYDFTSKLSLMLMGSYNVNKMNMLMDPMMAEMMSMDTTMKMDTAGIGDTQVAMMYKLDDLLLYNPMLTVAVSIPTGSIEEKFEDMYMDENDQVFTRQTIQPYDMQLGSGTWDITPSFSMANKLAPWELGYQVSYLWRTHENKRGYKWGDKFKLDLWTKYKTSWKATWTGGVSHAKWGKIEGRDRDENLTTNTDYYGGMRTDLVVGYAQDLPAGLTAEFRYSYPVHQYLNGFQMETDAVIELALQWMYMP